MRSNLSSKASSGESYAIGYEEFLVIMWRQKEEPFKLVKLEHYDIIDVSGGVEEDDDSIIVLMISTNDRTYSLWFNEGQTDELVTFINSWKYHQVHQIGGKTDIKFDDVEDSQEEESEPVPTLPEIDDIQQKDLPRTVIFGTLLIDQISEIPLDIQSKILRVLTDQKFKRINGNNDVSVDVRLICSSSKDLKKEIQIGNFREDLFHRINVFEINIEPLSQRISDIPLLIKYFSKKISENYNIKELEIDENNSYILNHNWKGNVRELRNLIERIAILQPNTAEKISNIIKESLKIDNFDDKIAEKSLSVPLKEAREKFEKEYLTIQLKKFNGNISKTANFVGMERSALHRKLKGLGIKEFN